MIRSLYTAVSGMITLENKQATITNNITNANTTGFKGDTLSMKSFDEVLIQNKDKISGGHNVKNPIGTLSLGTKIDSIDTRFTQGLLKSTNKPTDLAIDGRGFFAVKSGDQTVFTRDGSFRVKNDGYLVTNGGDPVLGINKSTGAMEPIFVGTDNFVIDNNNGVNVNGKSTHSLALADFKDYKTLKKVGDNQYTSENPVYNTQVLANQGALEQSNINLSNEMVEMITTMRSFETNQKMIQTIDESLGKAANEIGAIR
ncbi:flagellar hook-basal body complex protein [Clostridium gasigenes]|uniref:flagellar hook-basal body complex protein n=1 Tax=Clostridium gasigenes TaxID=94869 RepID=UPI001C0C5FF8|nr:flagellar hook-basal body complex protein [Clostridium gasigenes]MBU3109423.1 flagellar basal body rod protein FlgG [Clostridium gasigenes]